MGSKLIEEINEKDVIEIIKERIDKGSIAGQIEREFDCYFINKSNLQRYAKDFLVQDWMNIIKNEFNGKQEVLDLLSCFYQALSVNRVRTLSLFAKFQDITVGISTKYWTMCFMQSDYLDLGQYEYVVECFKHIEDICEVILKKFFAFLIGIKRTIQGKEVDLEAILKIKFGIMYNEIEKFPQYSFLVNVVQDNISISQWRNIACHRDYEYVNGKIICQYGTKGEKKEIIQGKERLLEVTKLIYKLSQIINFAFKFFTYDYIYDIKPYFDTSDKVIIHRDEDWQLIFCTELLAYGFFVQDIKITDSATVVRISDVFDGDAYSRGIQATIAIYKVWYYSGAKKIDIIYLDKTGEEYLKASSTADVCKEIGCGNKPISYLAENVLVNLL